MIGTVLILHILTKSKMHGLQTIGKKSWGICIMVAPCVIGILYLEMVSKFVPEQNG
jgi:hypothetical protein